jgi:hypothetical protein
MARHRWADAWAVPAAVLLGLLLPTDAVAFSSGSPVCQVTASDMSGAEGTPAVASPNGWSITVATGYNAGVPLNVGISNTNPGKQFRGILLWATNSAGTRVGSWTAPSGYQLASGCASTSLTHASSTAKAQRSFSFSPPPAGSGTLTFRAVLTEECGAPSCRTTYAFPNGVSVVESLYTLTVSRAGDGSGTVIHNPSGINCGASCSADFAANQSVSLLALPAQYSVFSAWSGCDSTVGDQCTVAMNAQRTVIASFPEAKLDVDGSDTTTRYQPATDGVLALRYLFGVRGNALTANALSGGATRNAAQIVAYLDARSALLDVDGNGLADAVSDGLLMLRYMLGLRGAALLAGANLGVLTGPQIESRLGTLMPQPAQ